MYINAAIFIKTSIPYKKEKNQVFYHFVIDFISMLFTIALHTHTGENVCPYLVDHSWVCGLDPGSVI